ncbi:HK97 family phage prohead protease [Micromonospora chalcea]
MSFAAESDPQPIDRLITALNSSGVSPRIGRLEAMSIPAVQRGRNLICSISTLPLVQYDPGRSVVRNPLLEQIDPDVPNVVTLAQTVEDLLFEGISWWRITGFGYDGYPSQARHLDVGSVSVNPPAGAANPAPLPSDIDPRGATVWVDGKPVPAEELIRFDSPNPGLLKVAGRAIRRALLLDQAAKMYAENPRPGDFFTPIEGVDPADDEVIQTLLNEWRASRREGSTAYVPAALKYNTVDVISPADLQLVELQKQASLDIANALGLDPEDLGISTTSRTYANAVDRRRDRINDVLSPYMRAITDRLSMGDVTRRGYTVGFDLDDYLRADPKTRFEVYKIAKDMGALTVEEIRAEEGLPALTSAQKRELTPAAPAVPAVAPEPVAASERPRAALELNDDTELTFADVPLETFAVNVEQRTITGLAVPFGQFALNQRRRWRFLPGSLEYSEIGRVKLLRDHDWTQSLGRALSLTESEQGYIAAFKVARGPEGDKALALAEDGAVDGLSIGVEILDAVPDPQNPGVHLVRRARLREVSLTATPAFDDSRVTAVAASRDEGTDMTDATEPQAPAAPADAPGTNTFSAAQVAQMIAAMAAGNGSVGIQQPQGEGRQVVNPTRVAMASVTEPEPYRFDARGNIQRGSHDFSSDLIAGSKGDLAAMERAESFVAAQFDVDRADVAGLNPNRQRPDMYVDQREYRYPVWNAINKGTLPDSTPFVFPKFNSASGLVNAHTEGTEPTPGTFTNTTQTVTPSAVSGRVEITREAWDQGGNPQMSNLIWRQMTRAWYEALEASAVAVLDAATPTAIALTAGGGTTGQTLDGELTAAFAALQFIRGGFSMDYMFTQIDLYKALVAAKDTTGRRLYPALGPANASGTARSRFAAIDVNGVTALPAWALAATGSVVASSYLFDSETVHGWATAPQRLEFQYRVAYVDLGIWGYKATAISDINGVREITYDPVA